MAAAGATVALLLALLGCPPPENLGRTCRFQGESATACGRCIREACQEKIDDCCELSYCASELGALDRCAAAGDCAELTTPSGLASPVGACVKTSCSAACGGAEAGIEGAISCEEWKAGGCRCTVSDATSALSSCSASSVAGGGTGICCAAESWPEDGAACACFPIRCYAERANPDTCVCGVYDTPDASEYEEVTRCLPERAACCKSPAGACRCGGDVCRTEDEEVSSCAPSNVDVSCDDGDREVTSCL